LILGLAGGLLGAAALAQILRHELAGIRPLDPAGYLGALAVFAAAIVPAALLPARRALAIDPSVTLRHE